MAIAFDATTALNQATATSLTYATTVTGSDVVGFTGVRTTGTCTGVTWNGVSMVQQAFSNGSGGSGINNYAFTKFGVTTGNVVVSMSSSIDIASASESLTGANQSDTVDATATVNTTSATSASLTFTTVADNCWLVCYGDDSAGGLSAGANTVLRSGSGNSKYGLDSGGAKTPPGSHSLNFSWGANRDSTFVGVSIAPAGGASGPANLKSLDTNVKANIKSYNTNVIANIKSINTNA